MSSLMGTKKNNFASYYEKQKKGWEKRLTTVIDSYLESAE